MDELGKSIPAAEGMVDAERSGSSKRNNEFCLNCGTKLVDAFCQHCGQKDLPQRQTLGELWSNFISSFWSYEGKFLLTTRYLLTRPGFLAVEYTKGKRESYYHPARMYVFISFVFFLLFFSLTDKIKTTTISKDAINVTDDDKKVLKEAQTQSNLDSILASSGADTTLNRVVPGLMDSIKSNKKNRWKNMGFNIALQKAEYKSPEAYDSGQNAKPEKDRDGWFKKRLMSRAIELNQKYKDAPGEFAEDFKNEFNMLQVIPAF